ncbi:hypothetical protein KRR40_12390 [Niabella defluvii]|nr:hypothetical protein KRR40_12390 [Niabella sp. I65]
MKRKLLAAGLVMLSCSLQAQKPYVSQVWSPDNGDGTYSNPVVNADILTRMRSGWGRLLYDCLQF